MPRRNTRKSRRRIGLYHVYNRSKDGRPMFMDDKDRRKFLEIFERYLVDARRRTDSRREYVRLRFGVRVLAFSLMANHFHLILFQLVPGTMEDLMHRTITAYVRYYNLRHGLSGPMFNGEYRADHKRERRSQLTAIAYVHDNHGDSCLCEFCSNRHYEGSELDDPPWLDVRRGLAVFGSVDAYRRFRVSRHAMRDLTKSSHRA